MNNWEKFERKFGNPSGLRATLATDGLIHFNKTVKDLLGESERAEFLFDRSARLIGLRSSDSENSYPIRPKKNTSFCITATAFCNYYGIDFSVKRTFTVYAADEILVIDLNDECV